MLSLEDLKLPPHNIDAEKALLSSVFLDNMTMEVCENTTIKHIDFYKKEHQCVYEAMTVLKQKFQTIDTITVADQLTKKDQLDSLGGMDYLYDLATYAMTSSSA
jgi:replicative DNA helicase